LLISWSVTLRLDATVKKAIASIDETAWQTIKYTDAVYDEPTGQWISRAEVAEVPSPRSARPVSLTRCPAG
jgi:hypothetical protein